MLGIDLRELKMNKVLKKISDLPGFEEFCADLQLSELTVEKIKHVRHLRKLNANLDDHSLTYVESTELLDRCSIPQEAVVLMPEGRSLNYPFSFVNVGSPSFVFWSLYEFVGRSKISNNPSKISTNCIIGSNASISKFGVIIEDDVVIDDNAVIKAGVIIKRGAKIGPGSVIGSNGLEIKDTSFGKIVITHSGGVIIGEDVELGALCTINQGLGDTATQIDTNTKIDSGVHIAHSCSIGPRNVIAANVTFGGSVKTGAGIFFGLNSTIKNRVEIADGCFIGASSFVAESYGSAVKIIPRPAKPLPL